jgi:hypothetical protein
MPPYPRRVLLRPWLRFAVNTLELTLAGALFAAVVVVPAFAGELWRLVTGRETDTWA